jgi:hypothetical protein
MEEVEEGVGGHGDWGSRISTSPHTQPPVALFIYHHHLLCYGIDPWGEAPSDAMFGSFNLAALLQLPQ